MSDEIQFLLYSLPNTEDGRVQVVVRDETIWATQKAMAILFGVQKAAISKHLKNIYDEGELVESTTVSKMETVVKPLRSVMPCGPFHILPTRKRRNLTFLQGKT